MVPRTRVLAVVEERERNYSGSVRPVRQELARVCDDDTIRKDRDVRQQFNDVRPGADVLGVLRPRPSRYYRNVPGVHPNLGIGVYES